jgi:hypothetical protein
MQLLHDNDTKPALYRISESYTVTYNDQITPLTPHWHQRKKRSGFENPPQADSDLLLNSPTNGHTGESFDSEKNTSGSLSVSAAAAGTAAYEVGSVKQGRRSRGEPQEGRWRNASMVTLRTGL